MWTQPSRLYPVPRYIIIVLNPIPSAIDIPGVVIVLNFIQCLYIPGVVIVLNPIPSAIDIYGVIIVLNSILYLEIP